MKLQLTRPLIFFDVESTGLNIIHDRIIEISYIKIFPDGEEKSSTVRINPGMPIPKESTAIHHITDDDVADCPRFEAVAQDLADVFADSDIAGFNSNHFDIPILDEEFSRAGIDFDWDSRHFIDVQTIFHKMEKRDLAAACLFYCGVEMQNHHESMADTSTTRDVLMAQLDRYPGLAGDVEHLSKFSSHTQFADLAGRLSYNDKKQEVITFGKYRGRLLEEVLAEDPGYYGWVMRSDFASSTKRVFKRVNDRIADALKHERLEQLKAKFSGSIT